MVAGAFIRNLFFMPLSEVNVDEIIRSLTIMVYVAGEDNESPLFFFDDEVREAQEAGAVKREIILYDMTAYRGFIGVPRRYGKLCWPDAFAAAENQMPRFDSNPRGYLNSILPRDAAQAEFFDAIRAATRAQPTAEVFINAQTGTGKTTAMLRDIAVRGQPAVVVVHLNKLMRQWYGSSELKNGIVHFFGRRWAEKYVGFVQQDRCDFKGRRIVLAMGPSLVSRQDRYPKELASAFGAAYVDELHKFCTPRLSAALTYFNAPVLVGATATPRDDPLALIASRIFGKPSVISTQKAMRPTIYVHAFRAQDGAWLNTDNEYTEVTSLSRYMPRNHFLAKIIYDAYLRGRNIMVMSDRTDQLQLLMRLVIGMGADADECGLHVGSYRTGKFALKAKRVRPVLYQFWEWKRPKSADFKIDLGLMSGFAGEKPHRRFRIFVHLFRAFSAPMKVSRRQIGVFDTRLAARKAGALAVREHTKTHYTVGFDVDDDRRTMTPAELDEILVSKRVVFCTYGIFDTGGDKALLDCMVEATPRQKLAQPIGRSLRIAPGKPTPEWHSITDHIPRVLTNFPTTIIGDYKPFIRNAAAKTKSFKFHDAVVQYVG